MIARIAFTALIAAVAATAVAATDTQLKVDAQAKSYRKLHIAPARVEFDQRFVTETNGLGAHKRRLEPHELDQIAREMGEGFRAALAEAFRKRGYEIAAAPAGDVLRVSPALKDVYVNAPREISTTPHLVRKAGRAHMVVEASDASGAQVLTASRQSAAGRTAAFHSGSKAEQRTSFDVMFRAYAEELAGALAAGK